MASTADGIGVTSGQSWIPTTFSEWLYVRLEVGALSVNALWALRAGRWGWRWLARRNGGVPLSWPYRLPSAMDIPYPTVMHVWIVGPESWRLLCSGPSVRRV